MLLAVEYRRKPMACGGCKKGNGVRHTGGKGGGNLRQFAFLSPRQLKLLKEQEAADNPPAEEEKE
jgi:hypothetical protein